MESLKSTASEVGISLNLSQAPFDEVISELRSLQAVTGQLQLAAR